MVWQIEWDKRAIKEANKLDFHIRKQIVSYLKEKISKLENPYIFGKALTGDKAGLWRYRVGDYRIICKIETEKLVIFVVRIGHRRKIYD